MEEQNKEEVKVETPIEPKQENNNGHKALLWFLIVLIVLLMGVGGFFAYKYFTNKDDKETDKPVEEKEEKKDEEKKDEQEDPQEQEEEKEDEPENPPTPVGEYETTIYLYDDAKQVCGFKKDESCNRILATIKTETKNPKLVAVTDGALFVLYDDNGLKINLDETVKFNVPEQNVSIHIYKVETSEYDDKSLDYYLDDDDTLIEKKNVLFDNETGLLATMEARHSDLEKFDLTLPPTYYCKGLFKHENILYSITFYLHDYKGENTNTFVDNYISNYIDII